MDGVLDSGPEIMEKSVRRKLIFFLPPPLLPFPPSAQKIRAEIKYGPLEKGKGTKFRQREIKKSNQENFSFFFSFLLSSAFLTSRKVSLLLLLLLLLLSVNSIPGRRGGRGEGEERGFGIPQLWKEEEEEEERNGITKASADARRRRRGVGFSLSSPPPSLKASFPSPSSHQIRFFMPTITSFYGHSNFL